MFTICLQRLLLFFPFIAYAGIFDWFESFSPKAERAKEILEAFEPKIEQAIQDYQVPGIAIGVVVDGHIIYSKGFGFRDVEAQLPMNEETLFAIGSCTKAFTTFVMGGLVDERKIHWDQPVIEVLPYFRMWDQYATTNTTIRDLLTHRTGMPRHEFAWYNAKISKEELLQRIRHLEPSVDLRERYQYGNLMYFVAGLAMEQVSGSTWEELVKERILIPLDMYYTNFSVYEMARSDNYAVPYIEKGGDLKKIGLRDLSLIGPAGGMNSNIHDLTHWLQMLLAQGTYNDNTMINASTFQELHAPQVVVPGAPETKESLLYAYAMGWGVVSYRGHYICSHDGISDGFTSVIGFLPQENIGFVVLTNKNMTTLPRYLSIELIDRLLELPHIDWIEDGLENIRKNKESMQESKLEDTRSRKKGTMPSHPLEEYVGLYENPGYGPLTIELVDNELVVNYNDICLSLEHWHYDVFSVKADQQDTIVPLDGTKFTFFNNFHGDVGTVSVPFEPTASDIVFEKKPEERLSNLTYLRKFAGVYEIYGYTVEIIVRDHALMAVIPGQPIYELVPAGENEFAVKSMLSSTVRFVLDESGLVTEALLIHPYGAFSAYPK